MGHKRPIGLARRLLSITLHIEMTLGPFPANLTYRGESIGCFPGLRDRYYQSIFANQKITVPELAGEIDLGRNTGKLLE